MKQLVKIVGLLFILLTLSSCLNRNRQQSSVGINIIIGLRGAEKLKVVTTVGMIEDVVKNVAGNCADIKALMGPGVDPHLYKASARDVRNLQYAQLILYSGYHLEGHLAKVLEKLAESHSAVAVAERGIPMSKIINSFQGAVAPDPHVWMDVSQWAMTVDVIRDELIKQVPECKDDINKRAKEYGLELKALHSWVKQSIASIPRNQRVLVTAHDAFAYYGRAYGLKVVGIQGISTAAEASLANIRDTVNTIVEKRIPAIFVESSINPRTILAVKAAVEDRGFAVKNGGQLYSDAMGQSGTADGTYIGMLFHNTTVITTALGGKTAPLPQGLKIWARTWGIK